MRTVFVLFLSLALIDGGALAETNSLAPPDKASSSLAQAQAGTLVATSAAIAARRRGHGRAGHKLVAEKKAEAGRSPASTNDPLSSCLAMWEPATHMTKREWARACQRVAERLKDTTIK